MVVAKAELAQSYMAQDVMMRDCVSDFNVTSYSIGVSIRYYSILIRFYNTQGHLTSTQIHSDIFLMQTQI